MNDIIIKTKAGDSLEIPIYDKVTVITGNSSSGKTKMIRWLQACLRVPEEVTYSTVRLEDILVISENESLQFIMNNNTVNKYIFIDHYSFVANNKGLIEFITESNNKFIIIGHRNTSGLTSQDAVLRMRHDGRCFICEQIYSKGILKPIEQV